MIAVLANGERQGDECHSSERGYRPREDTTAKVTAAR